MHKNVTEYVSCFLALSDWSSRQSNQYTNGKAPQHPNFWTGKRHPHPPCVMQFLSWLGRRGTQRCEHTSRLREAIELFCTMPCQWKGRCNLQWAWNVKDMDGRSWSASGLDWDWFQWMKREGSVGQAKLYPCHPTSLCDRAGRGLPLFHLNLIIVHMRGLAANGGRWGCTRRK